MAVYEWMETNRKQFHYIDNAGAFAELDIYQPKNSYVQCFEANNTYYVPAPQVLRRCFFLTVSEKAVLWELYSWFDKDAFCRDSLKTLSLYTGLSEKTVGIMILGLVEKGIISRKHTTSVDMFMLRDLSKNHYILLSEAIHYWYKKFISKHLPEDNRARKLENMFTYDMPFSVNLARKAVIRLIDSPSDCMRLERKLKQEGDFKELYSETMKELFKLLNDYYEAETSKIS
ncbi:helix-turn-helix domain-containing protein [Paenibacillus terrigena]|uniref:helix-turn-helix domain-containing protein n=1 Tax=Paenibacillus terrigena TaxID=369333 RepID=UPI0003725A11|nr:helix-turn-helix domain-containing protein [Paenibacillus terrigena]